MPGAWCGVRNGLRIVLVLGSSTGGVGVHVRSLSAGLVAAGGVVTVCGPRATEELFGFTRTGARFRPVEIPAGGHCGTAVRSVRALRAVLADADLAHAHGLRAGWVATLAGLGVPTPLVVTWHNRVLATGAAGLTGAAVERVVARRSARTLATSADLADMARRRGARSVRLAPVAAPPLPAPSRSVDDVRSELGAGCAQLVVVVSRLHPQKGLDVLVNAAARWRAATPPVLVVIAGEGPLRAELDAQIARTGGPVRLLGRRDDVVDLLAAADVVVLPSRWEARSLTAQEALRAGRALVATAVGGLPELVGDAALLIPPDDADALDRAVRRVLDDDRLRTDLATRGREQAASWPTEADTLAVVQTVYAEVVAPAVLA
ncbi:MAG: glycosyltransferase [Pseudonocardiales bacterium]|nr:MAG: glycosyltransferase [Pseudonocardiales bacterium]